MTIPLTAEETNEYNNVPTTPKNNPLGTVLNELASSGGGADPEAESSFLDDFLFTNLDQNATWAQDISGTGAALASIDGEQGSPGIIRCSTGTTTSGQAALTSDMDVIVLGGGVQYTLQCRFRVPTLPDVTDNFSARVQLATAFASGAEVSLILPAAGSLATDNWHAVTGQGANEESDTGVAGSAGSWVNLRIVVAADALQVTFYIDDVLVATNTLNIPTLSIGIAAGAIKTAGTNSRDVDIDYILLKAERNL